MIKLLVVAPFLLLTTRSQDESYRNFPCKTPALAASCLKVHGRLVHGNGTPSTRLWAIGTHHVYGIYSNQYGFLHDDTTLDNEGPNLPHNIEKQRTTDGFLDYIYADYEVCPLEPRLEGHMQAACIESATHIVAKH